MDKREFKITADGSHTLYVEALDETYHSKHGAIQEAVHVFIEAGLNYFNQPSLNVLEIGFGTGLNAFLTLLEAEKTGVEINYTGIEAFPLEEEIIKGLNYTAELNSTDKEKQLFKQLHQVEWESTQKITELFSLNKTKVELEQFETREQFNIIYFDAFGPRVQAEMWTEAIFKNMYNSLAKDGVLVTYCAKGSVKRTLKAVGFEVEPLPGPPGKREMTRAKKL
ncbi:MAG: tRNA (5-methylaminomethyl-2-thiouridine)(34)-methyltransferase MnmD [Flavobacteriales bacterium]|nr:tRNA (5-methylaminomethyl-2-thiouridine)(34)-methyltransferase MnmD [Flavobacteriales bacterium]